MKWIILIVSVLLIGCSGKSKEEKYASDLYLRITDQVYVGNGMSNSWLKIKDNIIAKKKILYMMSNGEFSILVVRNTFDPVADTTIDQTPDTSTITSSPEVDKITDAIKNLERLAKKMGGK